MVTVVTNNIKDTGITERAYTIVAKSLWNFFTLAMLIIGIGVTIFGLGFGKYRIGKMVKGYLVVGFLI